MNLNILTISNGDASISFCPERGGLITSLRLGGREILFMNQESLYDMSKNVRGGIPIMFPNAGPLDEALQKQQSMQLKQHGFARHCVFSCEEIGENSFVMKLVSSDTTKMLFPYDFELFISGTIEKNSIVISKKIINTGTQKLPIASGLHPYFFVPHAQKSHISFSHLEENFFDIWSQGNTKILQNTGYFEVSFPSYTLSCEYDSAFEYIWLWSEPDKDFICIEPVTRNHGGLLESPLYIGVGEEKEMRVVYGIK